MYTTLNFSFKVIVIVALNDVMWLLIFLLWSKKCFATLSTRSY